MYKRNTIFQAGRLSVFAAETNIWEKLAERIICIISQFGGLQAMDSWLCCSSVLRRTSIVKEYRDAKALTSWRSQSRVWVSRLALEGCYCTLLSQFIQIDNQPSPQGAETRASQPDLHSEIPSQHKMQTEEWHEMKPNRELQTQAILYVYEETSTSISKLCVSSPLGPVT